MIIDHSRYRVFTFDELVRLWCEDCYTEGEELGTWSEYSDPINVKEIVELIEKHEEEHHG